MNFLGFKKNLGEIMKYLTLLCFFAFSANAVPLKKDFIYLTWDNPDTSRSMKVLMLSSQDLDSLKVSFTPEDAPGPSRTIQTNGTNPNWKKIVPGQSGRFVYSVKLDKLLPGTHYSFTLFNDEDKAISETKYFKTLPQDDSPIHFVQGGDMGSNDTAAAIFGKAIEQNPDLILIGGDIAYANGNTDNWERWETWFEKIVTQTHKASGKIIPMVLAIGNHETNWSRGDAKVKSPFYSTLFQQSLFEKTYFFRTLGKDAVLLTLDTGHVASHYGEQKRFIRRVLKTFQHKKYRLALYHVPLYPSHRNYYTPGSVLGRRFWADEFTDGNLTVAFENHDHTLKRTPLMKNNDPSKDGTGTVFLGDGCFGRDPRVAKDPRSYLKVSKSVVHFWDVQMSPQKILYRAIGLEGEILDRFETSLKN